MDKARLDWVVSGLNQDALTKAEDVSKENKQKRKTQKRDRT